MRNNAGMVWGETETRYTQWVSYCHNLY